MNQGVKLVLAITLTVTGCSTETPPSVSETAPEISTPNYETPEAAFAAAKAAVQNKDYVAFCDCWSAQGLTWLSGGMALAANMYRSFSDFGLLKSSPEMIKPDI